MRTAPKYSIGAAAADGTRRAGAQPGPGEYLLPPAVGPQLVGRAPTAPAYAWGCEVRETTGAEPSSGPDRFYEVGESLGPQPTRRTAASFGFGTSERFPNRDEVRRAGAAPGPGSYARQHATGEQAVGGYRTQPSFRFGSQTRFGGGATSARAAATPSYSARSSVGKQVVSERRSTPSYGFGSSRRFADHPSTDRRGATPGPGSYNA